MFMDDRAMRTIIDVTYGSDSDSDKTIGGDFHAKRSVLTGNADANAAVEEREAAATSTPAVSVTDAAAREAAIALEVVPRSSHDCAASPPLPAPQEAARRTVMGFPAMHRA